MTRAAAFLLALLVATSRAQLSPPAPPPADEEHPPILPHVKLIPFAVAFDCPVQLPAGAVQVVRPAPGWIGFVPSSFLLHSVGVTVGRLQERATLRGHYQKLAHKAHRVSFLLDAVKGEKWLMCEYADGQIVQAQRLPDDTQRCDVLYTPDKHGLFAIQTTCHDRAPATPGVKLR